MYTIHPCGGDPAGVTWGIYDPDGWEVSRHKTRQEAEDALAKLVSDHEDRKQEAEK